MVITNCYRANGGEACASLRGDVALRADYGKTLLPDFAKPGGHDLPNSRRPHSPTSEQEDFST
jgi:hypothetical protein